MTNERIISRISDNTTIYFKEVVEGSFTNDNNIQLQGLKGEFSQYGFKNVVKAEGLKNAYYCDYESDLKGVKISQLKNYSKIDFAKFVDFEIDTFNAQLDNINVIVKRDNNKVVIIASMQLLVYYA